MKEFFTKEELQQAAKVAEEILNQIRG